MSICKTTFGCIKNSLRLCSSFRSLSTSSRLHVSVRESGKICVNGVDLFSERNGDGEKKLLCIRGALGTTQSDFKPQLEHLSCEFTVVAFDPRGYGKSQPPQRDFPQDFFYRDADDGAQLMVELGIDRYSVYGWSDGGIAAMILCGSESWRGNVDKLIVQGSNAWCSDKDVELLEKTRDLSKWSERMRKPLEDVYGVEGLSRIWSDWMDRFVSFKDNPNGDICLGSLDRISCPTLIVHGARDPLVPAFHPELLLKAISGARLRVFPEGKHNLHLRYFQEFNEVVTEFLNE